VQFSDQCVGDFDGRLDPNVDGDAEHVMDRIGDLAGLQDHRRYVSPVIHAPPPC
jgi:hypothetical protein